MAQPNLPKIFDDSDDDDQPITFKRFAKKSPLHSEVKKTTSNSHGGQSNGKITDLHSSNGQTSKPSPMKPCSGISKPSNSPSLGDKPKPVNVKNEMKPIEHSSKGYCEDSEDDDDDKPLSSKWKIKSNHDNKVVAPVVVKKSSQDSDDDDDDDDVPLSAKFSRKSNLGTSNKKPVSKVQKERQNGSSTSCKQQKSSTLPVKRELENCESIHSLVKKSKVSDSAASIKTKQVSVKCEIKATEEEDDDDELPISERFKKSPKLTDKPSSTKKILTKVTKVNKSGSTSFKKQTKSKQTKNKSKQSGRDSEYSKSSTLLPSSGDGQKKWTTLVHNGVIFPPPYQPHGVKMLYKGKPVDLTPEQEEVRFNI